MKPAMIKGQIHSSGAHKPGPACLDRAEHAIAQGLHASVCAMLDDQAVAAIEALAQPELLLRLAAVFHQIRQLDRAEYYYRYVLKRRPHALACINLAHICSFRGQVSEAIALRRQALALGVSDAGLLRDLGSALIFMGDKQAGIESLRQAVTLAPQDRDIHSSYLFRMHYMPDWPPEEIYEEHRRWAQQHAPLPQTAHGNIPDPERALRIGYISPDFRSHPVACFFEPLLDGHDRQRFQVFGYGNVACPDELTSRLQDKFCVYRSVFGSSDEALAQQIQADKIDILVDLAGHTPGNRLGVLALKPAPLQGSYLGYPDTTGMDQVDFRLTDELSTPVEARPFYTEECVSLPQGFLCYRAPNDIPDIGPLPALRNAYVTFGAFNDTNKLNQAAMALWVKIIRAVAGSRLLIKSRAADDPVWCRHLKQRLGRMGLASSRVRIEGQKTTRAYFQLYNEVDIALDSYPYNGTTTMCDALWMGVPVISLVGRHHVSRVGLSILSQVGLEFFAATTPDEYWAKAIALAGKPNALASIRRSLRHRVMNSPLYDHRALAQQVENAFRQLWQRRCGETAKNAMSVKPTMER